VGGQNTGVVNVGNGNKVLNNSGEVLGVLIQKQVSGSGSGGEKGKVGRGGGGAGDVTTTINAVNNLGNANGQANVGAAGKKGGSTPNQNSTQTFISQ